MTYARCRGARRAGLLAALALLLIAIAAPAPSTAQGLDDDLGGLAEDLGLTGGAVEADAGPQEDAETGPAGDPFAVLPVPEFRDPYAEAAGPPPCDRIDPAEREKFACPEASEGTAADTGAGEADGSGTDWADAGADAGAEGGLDDGIDLDLDFSPDDELDTGEVGRDVPDDTLGAPRSGGGQPLRNPLGLDRRVLTLPGAAMTANPGSEGGVALPAFSIYYVYAEKDADGARWLEVGKSAAGGAEGWIRAEDTENWKTMLVMQYAPKGDRGRVLFFKRRNEIIQFVRDPYVAEEARLAYQEIESGEYQDDFFVAIEPGTDIDPDETYLMPILDWEEEMFDSLEEVKLLEVAGLNLDANADLQQDVTETRNLAPSRRSSVIRDFKFGITFVVDTTSSMGRYIDYTRGVVHAVMKAFAKEGLDDKVSFGLVGYRDNMEHDPSIEYVTRTYQQLDPEASIGTVVQNFELMQPAETSTKGFDEDALAGLDVAINGMGWEPYDFRMVILITDAGARRGTDPMAANPGYDVINALENAERRNVALSVVHLLTPEAARAGNIEPAREVYRALSRSGDATTPKYFGVDTTDGQAFVAQIKSFAQQLVSTVARAARGRRVERSAEVATLGDALVNEVFRSQLEYIGAKRGQKAPRFYRAWAADKDLINQTVRALEVKVFLTRQQLAALMQGAETILEAYERRETGGGDFFEQMQTLAAQTTVEGAGSRTLEEAGDLFPAFLRALPYESDFLELDEESWQSGGATRQRELTELLRSKLRVYRDIAQSQQGWIDLGSGERSEDVYAIGLEYLP